MFVSNTECPAIDFIIKLSGNNDINTIKKFEDNLLDVASPSSVNYGKWYSKAEAIEAIAPSEDSLTIVTEFIASYGVNDVKVSVFKVLPENIVSEQKVFLEKQQIG